MTEEQGSFVMDVAVAALIVGGIVGGLFLYAGVWPPLVVVESGSMMHEDAAFGRVGTVDPGDLVLVTQVQRQGDVVPFIEGCIQATGDAEQCRSIDLLSGCPGGHGTYGSCGDVIVFDAGRGTPVIHRAMAWVEVRRVGGEERYTVPGYGIDNASSITIESLGIRDYEPSEPGFITKGDSRFNFVADQVGGHSAISANGEPVGLDAIIGKARGELPWFGLIKLAVAGNPPSCLDHRDWPRVLNACAPGDLWLMLGVSVTALVLLPNALTPAWAYAERRWGPQVREMLGRKRREGDRGRRGGRDEGERTGRDRDEPGAARGPDDVTPPPGPLAEEERGEGPDEGGGAEEDAAEEPVDADAGQGEAADDADESDAPDDSDESDAPDDADGRGLDETRHG